MRAKKNGFTLIEALISSFIVVVVIFESMMLFYKIIELQKYNEKQLGLIASRNKLLSLVVDERGWGDIVQDASNTEFSCWINQGSATASDRNCFGKNQSLKLKWIDGVTAYDPQNTSSGLTYNGDNCSSFASAPNPINKSCPVRFDVKWSPICVASPCENPPLKIEGDLIFRADDRVIPNIAPYKFRFIRSNVFCPTQAASNNTVIVTAGVNITPTSVISTATGLAANTGKASNNVDLFPCQSVRIRFNEQVVTSQAGLPVPLLMTDANNTSSVCLGPPGGACDYQWRRTGTDYQLLYQGAVVGQKPASIALDPTTDLEFQVINGLVRFCANDVCHMFFNQKLVGPFRIYLEPSNADYSGGIRNITVLVSKTLSYSY